jgi:hypothetical protein
VDEKLFRTLLYQSEGPDLDFKRDQYAFKGADDLNKSKLLKDVLTFANSWRLGDAHVLIGVEDLSNGCRDPRGIPPGYHIDDASLQQFVNSKTNREVKFSYEAFLYDGKSFGVITIPKQKRPLYANKDFWIVKAGEIYFRRGSSCAIATIDDVYQMGVDDEKEFRATPVIRLELADLARRVTFGTSARLETINHEHHNKTDYPDEVSDDRSLLARISNHVNRNYWRELADYIVTHRASAPIGFAATNASGELARNVQLEINQPKDAGIAFMGEEDLPEYPNYRSDLASLPRLFNSSMLNPPKGTPKVLDHDDRWTLLVDFGDIQPQKTSWAADPIYVAANAPGLYRLSLKIYADNLSKPQEGEIELDFVSDKRPALTLEQLSQFQDEYWKKQEEGYN